MKNQKKFSRNFLGFSKETQIKSILSNKDIYSKCFLFSPKSGGFQSFENKKALLLKTVAWLVIGAICLLILFYAGWKVYGFFSDQSSLQQAEKNIKLIKIGLDIAKTSEKNQATVNVFGPVDWWIIAWPYQNKVEKPYHEECKKNKYCICICYRPTTPTQERSLENCNSLGTCIGIEDEIKTYTTSLGISFNAPISIENPPMELKIKYSLEKGYELS